MAKSIEGREPSAEDAEQRRLDLAAEIVKDQANLDPEYVENGLKTLKSKSGYQWADAEGHLAGRIFIDADGKLKELKRPIETHWMANPSAGISGMMTERGNDVVEEIGKERLQSLMAANIEFARGEKEKLERGTRKSAKTKEEIERYEGDIEIAKGMIIALEKVEK